MCARVLVLDITSLSSIFSYCMFLSLRNNHYILRESHKYTMPPYGTWPPSLVYLSIWYVSLFKRWSPNRERAKKVQSHHNGHIKGCIPRQCSIREIKPHASTSNNWPKWLLLHALREKHHILFFPPLSKPTKLVKGSHIRHKLGECINRDVEAHFQHRRAPCLPFKAFYNYSSLFSLYTSTSPRECQSLF